MIDEYDIGSAARALYDFVWGDVCDWYLEMSKPALKGDEGEARRRTAQGVLEEVFQTTLPLLHPFIPFVTEELLGGGRGPGSGLRLEPGSARDGRGRQGARAPAGGRPGPRAHPRLRPGGPRPV